MLTGLTLTWTNHKWTMLILLTSWRLLTATSRPLNYSSSSTLIWSCRKSMKRTVEGKKTIFRYSSLLWTTVLQTWKRPRSKINCIARSLSTSTKSQSSDISPATTSTNLVNLPKIKKFIRISWEKRHKSSLRALTKIC